MKKKIDVKTIGGVHEMAEYINVLTNDALKMYQALETFVKGQDRTLLPPAHMKSPLEGKAFMNGSNAALKQMSGMAQFTIQSLDLDYMELKKENSELQFQT